MKQYILLGISYLIIIILLLLLGYYYEGNNKSSIMVRNIILEYGFECDGTGELEFGGEISEKLFEKFQKAAIESNLKCIDGSFKFIENI